jgi:hypothetical protein
MLYQINWKNSTGSTMEYWMRNPAIFLKILMKILRIFDVPAAIRTQRFQTHVRTFNTWAFFHLSSVQILSSACRNALMTSPQQFVLRHNLFPFLAVIDQVSHPHTARGSSINKLLYNTCKINAVMSSCLKYRRKIVAKGIALFKEYLRPNVMSLPLSKWVNTQLTTVPGKWAPVMPSVCNQRWGTSEGSQFGVYLLQWRFQNRVDEIRNAVCGTPLKFSLLYLHMLVDWSV